MTDLEELKKLEEAASIGPWERGDGSNEVRVYCDDALGTCVAECDSPLNSMPIEQRRRNMAFIAAARSALPALIERVEAAEAENARLREMVERFCNIMQHCTVTDGSCCCGEDMANHSAYSGHAPTDHGSRVADRALEDALELLGRQS